MIFGQNRDELRKLYGVAWRKRCDSQPLTRLESQIAAVVEMHPEYHETLTGGDIDRDYSVEAGETNPYLHMGLHLGLRDQVATDRPQGIADVFSMLAARLGDVHAAEHRMIECLAETLWDAQRRASPPDEDAYLERLKRL